MHAPPEDFAGHRAYLVPSSGPPLESERDATDLIGETFGAEAPLVVIPAARLSADFFRLSTRKAGLFIQKFATYQVRLAIVGDIDAQLANSRALTDFVRESNKGRVVTFARDLDDLRARLGVAATRG